MSKLDYLKSIDGFCKAINRIEHKGKQILYRYIPSSYKKNVASAKWDKLYYPHITTTSFPAKYFLDVLNTADSFLSGKYDILGSGELQIEKVNWSKDYKSGYEWKPGTFYTGYVQEGISTNSDVKWPREISRAHQLLQCAVAYDATQNEKYAEFVVNQILDFISSNPLMRSINWGCTMDVAIRAVNWIWALAIIQKTYQLDTSKRIIIEQSLYEHGWFIYRNPEGGMACNHNHYLADLSGQIQLGLLFRDSKEGNIWLSDGINQLYKEIRSQILPTGMSYERSTHYNRLVLELILVPVLQLKQNGYEVPQDIWYRIETMFDFISHILQPDGEVPIIGDQDNGRLLPFSDGQLNNFRYLMSLGALLFVRSDFKQLGEGYNLYCRYLVDNKTEIDFDSLPVIQNVSKSMSFPDAGFYLMRKDKDYLLFNASGKGLNPEISSTTHTHSDLLSFVLSAAGEQFLIDPGSFVYTADAEQRMYFRSTEMHNTATVDGESQNILRKENLWDFERNAIPLVQTWESNEKYDLISASHNGYCRLPDPVTHRRTIRFSKESPLWSIRDQFSAKKNHNYCLFFHVAEGIGITKENDSIILKGKTSSLQINFSTDTEINLEIINTFISRAYGVKKTGEAIVVKIHANKSFEILTNIIKI